VYGGEHDEDNPLLASSSDGEPAVATENVGEAQVEAPFDVEGEQPLPPAEPEPISVILSRVEVLTVAIEEHPDAPVNYVLRGEVLMDGGDQDLAAEDFQKALELAEAQAETANWGYIYRAVADRAREGLRRIRLKQM
jgi:hypothetical protein